MKKIISLSILIFSITKIYSQTSTQCQKTGIFLPSMPACTNGNYYLAFEDNFDGNTLDFGKWDIPYQGCVSANFSQSKQWYANTGSTPSIPFNENIEVSNGTLKLMAKRKNVSGTYVINWDPLTYHTETFDYTSAEVTSKKQFLYGKYEIRCRLPEGKGFWPAFWTFGGPGWNEIDFFEIYGSDIDRFTCNVHYDFDGDGKSENCSFAKDNAADFTNWHTFTCFYDFDKIEWQIDGQTVRILHRYSTVSGKVISCGDNIANGTYFQELSYPQEKMNIIMNLAIESGSKAPDANTIFPNTYEIDYVRFYVKSQKPPCDGCLDNLTYENTNQLPTVTRAENYIQAGNNVTVQNGQKVKFKAPTINLLPGFTVENGGDFSVFAEACDLMNYEDVSINFIGSNATNNQVIKCINPIYTIEATGVLFYSARVHNLSGQLIHSTTGTPTSNHINLWNAVNAAEGWYKIKFELLNCSASSIKEFTVFVTNGNCRVGNPFSDSTHQEEAIVKQELETMEMFVSTPTNIPYQESQKTTYSYIDSVTVSNQNAVNNQEIKVSEGISVLNRLLIYPNPVNDKLNIFYSVNETENTFISITDISGKELFKEETISNYGANRKTIDVAQFVVGTYIIRIFTNGGKTEQQFILTR